MGTKKKGSALGNKFRLILDGFDRVADQYDEEARYFWARDARSACRGPGAASSARLAGDRANTIREHTEKLRSYLPYVDQGLMTPLDVVKEVNASYTPAALLEMGKLLANATVEGSLNVQDGLKSVAAAIASGKSRKGGDR